MDIQAPKTTGGFPGLGFEGKKFLFKLRIGLTRGALRSYYSHLKVIPKERQKTMNFDIHTFDVQKFDSILARGLSKGMGKRGEQVCIEAAICETLDLPHSDDPQCVADITGAVHVFKIDLNDAPWSSPEAHRNLLGRRLRIRHALGG